MEFVEGLPVDRYCQQHQLGLQDRCALFLNICAAVSYAHRNLVVHRDLKPGNILIGPDGTPKLLDFGIAKLLQPDSASAGTITSPALALGTPDYASPEQLQGRAITTATDVYSLGAILLQLLTGQTATQAQNLTPSRLPVSRGSETAAWRRHLAGDIDAIILKSLRPEPDRRYVSVDALRDDIDRYLHGQPVSARVDSWSYRAGKWLRRHRSFVAAATALAFISAFGANEWNRWNRTSEARRLYLAAREEMTQDSDYPMGRAMQLLEQSLQLDRTYAPAHVALANAHLWMANRSGKSRSRWAQAALQSAQNALRIAPGDPEAHAVLGALYAYTMWNFAQAEQELRQAALAQPWRIAWQISWVKSLTILGRFDDGLRVLDAAEQVQPGQIEYQIQRALLLLYARRPQQALATAREVLARDPNSHESYWVLGMALEQAGRLPEAIEVMREGLSRQHRDTRLEAALGHAYGLAHQRANALNMARLIERPPSQVATFVCTVCEALIYASLGDADETMRWLTSARAIQDNSLPFVPADPRYALIERDPRFQELVRWLRQTKS